MCIECVTEPGKWIESIGSCARQERVTIPEAVDMVIEEVDSQGWNRMAELYGSSPTEEERESIRCAIRRDGAAMIDYCHQTIERLQAVLPAVPDNAEGVK